MAEKPSVCYAYSKPFAQLCNIFEKEPFRASSVHALVHAYDLFPKMAILAPHPAAHQQLLQFHNSDYLDFLKSTADPDVDLEDLTKDGEEIFGVGYDCPLKRELYSYVELIAGASVQCAAQLINRTHTVAINWGGGWHHSRAGQAAGFCYVNDCVLAVLKLREHYQRVLHLDFDAHHGDAVQDAFCTTSQVLTVSFHMLEPGFYPGSGRLEEVGIGKGKLYAINAPLKQGLTDAQWIALNDRLLPAIVDSYRPQVIVVQCGADGLSRDPIEAFNLTPRAFLHSLDLILGFSLPVLLLGGGGYHRTNVARCWTQLTARAVLGPGHVLPDDIPEHALITQFGPDYSLTVEAGRLTNLNSSTYLSDVEHFILERLKLIKSEISLP